MRKIATVRRVDAVNPIPDADAIEVAAVGGWMVVYCLRAAYSTRRSGHRTRGRRT